MVYVRKYDKEKYEEEAKTKFSCECGSKYHIQYDEKHLKAKKHLKHICSA